ncbi:hypothetical protein ABFW14_28060 [Mycolicibacterium fortuitum]|uniref:hypothetical protein n=1 Tax=Mycolicibacterium fortuitum TaxID=1766 RepID=UPI0034CE6ED0
MADLKKFDPTSTTISIYSANNEYSLENRETADRWEDEGNAVGATAMRVAAEAAQQLREADRHGVPEDLVAARRRAALKVMAQLGLSRADLYAAMTLAGERTLTELNGLDYEDALDDLTKCARSRCGENVSAPAVLDLLDAMWPDVVMAVAAEVRRYASPDTATAA